MKKLSVLFFALTSTLAFAELKPLDNQALQSIEGQSGADLSWKLTLNQNVLTTAQLSQGVKPTYQCDNGKTEYCRLAISPNKRFVDPNTNAPSDISGNRLWLVFKGLQGTFNIQKLGLDGADLVVGNTIKPAMQLSFLSTKPIQIRDFGFTSLAIEKDSFISTQTSTNVLSEPTGQSGYGYLNKYTYSATAEKQGLVANGATTADAYDAGKERGFMGMQMNGNLALQGQIMMFSCDSSSNKRC